jgi:hypothetical protein
MKKLIIGLSVLLFVVTATAIAVPQFINYQGMLRDSAGDLQDGTFNMTFKIYSASSGGTMVYDSGSTSVTVSNGLYNVELPATSSVFDGNNRWLDVTVGTDTLSPRLKINSVAYAITADSVGSADYASVAGTATNAASADQADYATLSGTATNAGMVDNFSANGTPTSGQLYPLQTLGSDVGFSGIAVSAESASGIALFVAGKFAAAGITGVGTISSGSNTTTITNSYVTSQSIILPIITDTDAADHALKIESITNGTSFIVRTVDETSIGLNDITFRYIIIN